MKNNKKLASIIALILSIVLAVVGGFLIFVYMQHQKELNSIDTDIEQMQTTIKNKQAEIEQKQKEKEEAFYQSGHVTILDVPNTTPVSVQQVSFEEMELDSSVIPINPDASGINCNKMPLNVNCDVGNLVDGTDFNWQIPYVKQDYESSRSCPRIIYKYEQPVSVQYLRFRLGNWIGEDASEYKDNYRPGYIVLRLTEDHAIGLKFEDKKYDYVIRLDEPVETDKLTFYLYKLVYPADDSLANDELVISEMNVYGAVIEPDIPDEAENEIKPFYDELELEYNPMERISQEPIPVQNIIPFKEAEYDGYPAQDAFDNDESTSWQYIHSKLNGEIPAVTVQTDPEIPVSYVDFRLGKWPLDLDYLSNCRPVSITISADGYQDLEIQFQDLMKVHSIKLPQSISASAITFTINDISAENANCDDVAISDITMWSE